jgi:hypothetical protein
MRRLASFVGVAMLAAATGACSDSEVRLAHPGEAERGEQVDTDSFLDELATSFSTGSTAAITFVVRGPVTLSGRGVVKYAKDRMDLDVRIDDWKVKGATVNLRTVNNTTYLKAPESRGVWVDVSSGKGEVPGAGIADEADPRSQLGELRKSIDEVRFTGDDRVAGTRTRRYQVVTVSKANRREVTDYWFDRRGRVVRRASDLDGTGEAIFTWAEWGKPVRIVAPPRRSVITFERLEQLQRQPHE